MPKRKSISGQGADAFFEHEEEYPANLELPSQTDEETEKASRPLQRRGIEAFAAPLEAIEGLERANEEIREAISSLKEILDHHGQQLERLDDRVKMLRTTVAQMSFDCKSGDDRVEQLASSLASIEQVLRADGYATHKGRRRSRWLFWK